jgi:Carboxypeptidase regulatory-like domain/TonB dependent receptor
MGTVHMKRSFLICVAALLLMAAGAWAQTNARFSGTVKDQSGGVVGNATVTLTNQATGINRTAKTENDGSYLFPVVDAGVYRLTVEHTGFKKNIQNDITLEVNQNGRLDVVLEIGSAAEAVEVSAAVAQVDTTGAVLGKVEDTKRIQDLPLVDRDTLQLGLLQAGVFAPDPDDGSGNPFSVSGQRSESLTFLLDGADNTNFLGNNIVVNPNPDAVQEFKILTNNYDAQFGRSSGGIVNQVIKSGSNQFHGSAFEFLRNDVFNARDFFLTQRPNFKRNVFGGTLGGPIKKDKTFIFGSYQGSRRREGQPSSQLSVLSVPERTGNFSELFTGQTACPNPTGADPTFDAGQLFVPGTTSPVTCTNTDANGNPVTAVKGTPYNNNQVPVNPVSANYIAKFVPLPTIGTNGFISAPTAAVNEDQGVLRVDHTLTKRDTLSGTYVINDFRDALPFQVNKGASTGGDVPVGSGITDKFRTQTLAITWTHSFERGWINEFRASANRSAQLQASPDDHTTASDLGFTNVNPDDPLGAAPPIIFTPGFNLGPSPQGPTTLHDMTYQYQDTITIPRGRHEWKFGADVRRVQNNFNFDFFTNGSFTFGGAQGGPLPGGTFTGDAAADFVGGFPGNFFQFSNAVYAIRTTSEYYFAQDTFKVLPRLTLNLGVRYEYNSPQYDIHNEIIGFFGAGVQSKVFPNAPPGILYPGDPGTPNRALVYPDRNNWAPRVGFAWDMFGNAKLVMRGGFGIFYDIEDGGLNLQFGGQAPFGDVLNLNFQPGEVTSAPNFLADPFTPIGLLNPFPFASRGLQGTFFTPKVSFAFVTDPHFRTPYSENFNYGFQYQLTKDTAIEAVYVGSLGRKLISTIDVNPPQPSVEITQLNNGFLNEDCTRPLAACINATTDKNAGVQDIGQLLTNKSNGISASHEFQLTVDRRFSHGLSFRAAYTLSKTTDLTSGFRSRSSTYTDPFDPALDHGLADFDATHRLVFSGSWELPIDRPFRGNRIMKKVTEGWQANVIASFQSGTPFTIFSNNDNSAQGNFLDRPNLIGKIKMLNPRQVTTFSAAGADCSGQSADNNGNISGNFGFDPTAFDCTFNSDGHLLPGSLASFGDLARNTLRGPGINNWDISFLKDTKITESRKVEFRAEFFNAFNHAQFLNPDAGGFSGTFGQISQTRGPRLIQFGLKLYF